MLVFNIKLIFKTTFEQDKVIILLHKYRILAWRTFTFFLSLPC